MPQPCHPELLLSQAEGREMTQCILQNCYRSPEAQCFSPYWKCHSCDGNPAVAVCLFCPSAYHYGDKTTLNKLTKALELNRVIVCALFAVALITWLCIQTEAVFTDFLAKELALISIWGENIKALLPLLLWCHVDKQDGINPIHFSVQANFSLNRKSQEHRYSQKKNPSDNWCGRGYAARMEMEKLVDPYFPLSELSPVAQRDWNNPQFPFRSFGITLLLTLSKTDEQYSLYFPI